MNTNIIDYGAVSGGGLCTEAIQRAIDECERSGGGRVTVPPGLYKTGTIWLKSNVELHLEHGSILKASDNLKVQFLTLISEIVSSWRAVM